MSIHLKGKDYPLSFDRAERVEWVERRFELMHYGKKKIATESWMVLYDAPVGGNELARFKGSEVRGYHHHGGPALDTTSLLAKFQGQRGRRLSPSPPPPLALLSSS